MYLVLAPILLVVISCIFAYFSEDHWSNMHPLAFLGLVIGSSLLGFVVIFIPLNRLDTYAAIDRFEAICASYQGDSLSNTDWNRMVAEQNAGLANKQYYNTTIFDWAYPDVIMDIQPLGDRCKK